MLSPICFTNFFHEFFQFDQLNKKSCWSRKRFLLSLPVEKKIITNIRKKILDSEFVKPSDEFVKYQMGTETFIFEFQEFSPFSCILYKFLFGGKMCYFCFNTKCKGFSLKLLCYPHFLFILDTLLFYQIEP